MTLGAVDAQLPWSPSELLADATTPACADNESLFELLINNKDWGAPTSYRVFTESTGDVHHECTDCRFRNNSTNAREEFSLELCLPKVQCHTFVVGRMIGRFVSCDRGGTEELIVKWGGKILRSSNAYLFDSVDFGEGCPENARENPRCDPDNEIEFEFFLDRWVGKHFPDAFTWALTEVAADENKAVFLEGQALKKNESSFVYERACVPRSSCLEFYMGYPSQVTSTSWMDRSPYSIRLDGVIYAEHELFMGLDLAKGNKLNQTVYLGNECNVETICNSAAEDLFAMEFTTRFIAPCNKSNKNKFTSSSAISYIYFPFWLQDPDKSKYDEPYIQASWFSDFEVIQKYASMTCIPNDKCAQFFFGTDNPVIRYKLFQNGEELKQRVFLTGGSEGRVTMTNAGNMGVCPSVDSEATQPSIPGKVMTAALTVLAVLNLFW